MYVFVDGGDSAEVAVSCSGGRRDTRCWSARFMWRTAGAGEFYTYLPSSGAFEKPNEALCKVKPYSTCNPTYGASVGRGSFTFKSGVWNQISQRVLLNDVGQANGELELFFNGESVINVGGLMLRGDAAGKIRGIIMQTFFGGTYTSLHSPILLLLTPILFMQATNLLSHPPRTRTRTFQTSRWRSPKPSRSLY